jgi:hypothetical protein
LLSPVNPKTKAEKCDRIRIGAILRLDDDENRAGLVLKTEMLVEVERADIDFRSWHKADVTVALMNVRFLGKNGHRSFAV